MPVVDASVLVSLLVEGEEGWAGTQILRGGTGRSLWAPHLVDAEVGHALRRLAATGKISEEDAAAALQAMTSTPLRRIAHPGLLERAWRLRHNLSFYDGLYVALAEHLDLPLLTLDGRLAKAASDATDVTMLTAS